MPKDMTSIILDALEAGAAQEGLDIVDVEVVGPADHRTVRVRIDTLDDGDIDMQTVIDHTPWVSQVVEAVDPFPGAYELEVSSPGIDRPLRRLGDFARFAGSEAEVHLAPTVEGRRKGTGVIQGADEAAGTVTLALQDGEAWTFPIQALATAKIKPDYAAIFSAAKAASAKADEPRPDEGADPEDADADGDVTVE